MKIDESWWDTAAEPVLFTASDRTLWPPAEAAPPVFIEAVNPRASLLSSWLIPPLCVLLLAWPALWNGYPIVFADTGTYLSQAMHRYLGWDRPAFYSLFIYPWHLGITTWPVILVQSSVTVLVLDLTRRGFGVSRMWLLPLTAFLAVASWLPWIVSELMPDLFTPLLVLLLTLRVFLPDRFRPWERAGMVALAAFMISAQQSSVPLACALLSMMIPAALFSGTIMKTWAKRRALTPLLAPMLAIVAMTAVNFAGFGRLSLSPFGNVFVLAQVIYDGPGMDVLRRDCPDRGWRLCSYVDRFPPSADEFLWQSDSPIMLAGGHKAVSAEADAIIHAAVRAEPALLLRVALEQCAEATCSFRQRRWARRLERAGRILDRQGLSACRTNQIPSGTAAAAGADGAAGRWPACIVPRHWPGSARRWFCCRSPGAAGTRPAGFSPCRC